MSADPHRALPRGPHGLSREEVELSQRARLLQATTEAVAEQGYVKTTVADILARAGANTSVEIYTGLWAKATPGCRSTTSARRSARGSGGPSPVPPLVRSRE